MEKEEKVKITAVIKTKNCEDSICSTLESIKNLDEIIVVDENSNDDTIEIAKEYRAKIIFANNNELKETLNKTLKEAQNDWVFIIEPDEIIPKILIEKLEKIIKNKKFDKNFITLPVKTFYLEKELKCAKNKAIKLFKKDCAEFLNNYSLNLKLKAKKSANLNFKSKEDKDYVFKYLNKSLTDYNNETLEKIKALSKNKKETSSSIIINPFISFIYFYFIKKGFQDGIRGYIYAKQKADEIFILNVLNYEKKFKEQKNDI